MNTWAPIWSASPDSSLWDESDVVFKVFWTMMAIKDADHIVRFTAYQIGRKARKTEAETLEALKVLSSPDTRRLEPQEYDGRRIEKVEDGWLILNGQKYRDKVSDEMRKARNRKAQAAWRERQKSKKVGSGTPLAGERAAVKAEENGDYAGAEAIAAAALPEPTSNMCISAASDEGEKMNIPEIPLRGEERGEARADGDTAAEPGQWVDGVWVPD